MFDILWLAIQMYLILIGVFIIFIAAASEETYRTIDKRFQLRKESTVILTILFIFFWPFYVLYVIFMSFPSWMKDLIQFIYSGLYLDKLFSKSKRKNEFKWKDETLEIINDEVIERHIPYHWELDDEVLEVIDE